jgi:hypothetical protein
MLTEALWFRFGGFYWRFSSVRMQEYWSWQSWQSRKICRSKQCLALARPLLIAVRHHLQRKFTRILHDLTSRVKAEVTPTWCRRPWSS